MLNDSGAGSLVRSVSLRSLMRISLMLPVMAILAAGCLAKPVRHGGTAFNFSSSDIVSATAEPVDQSRLDTREGAPHYEAQLHLVLNDSGMQRLQSFAEAHDQQTVELWVNGEVLVPGVGVSQLRGGVREMSWFVGSMEEAQHFAAFLQKK